MKPTTKTKKKKASTAAKGAKAGSAKPVSAKANGAAPKPVEAPFVLPKPREVARPNNADQALLRLGVTQNALDTAAEITSMIARTAGGVKGAMAAMRFAPDDLISKFLERYDAVPVDDRRFLSIEAVALAAGINPSYLLGSITVAMRSWSVTQVKLLATDGHPGVTEARLKYAQLAGGERDRTAIDQALGFLPTPKPSMFGNVNIGKASIFNSGRNVMEAQGAGRGDEDENDEIDREDPDNINLDKLFPPANAMQEKLALIRNRQKLLPGVPESSRTETIALSSGEAMKVTPEFKQMWDHRMEIEQQERAKAEAEKPSWWTGK